MYKLELVLSIPQSFDENSSSEQKDMALLSKRLYDQAIILKKWIEPS